MRILFLAPRFHTNQADIVRKLQEEGHQVDFLVALTAHSEDHSRAQPIVLSQSALGRWVNGRLNRAGDVAATATYTLPPIQELWGRLRELNPDVVIIRSFPSLWLLAALPWLLAHPCRLVLYTQRPKFGPKPSLWRRAGLAFGLELLRMPYFTTVERCAADPVAEDRHRQITFIPFFKYPDESARDRRYAWPPRFLAVAKFTRRKNLSALVEAFAKLPARDDLTLTIVGENTRPDHHEVMDELQAQVARLELRERVRFLQNIKYREVQALYAQSEVFMMCSYGEPASVSQVEAMAHGVAVVCNRDNGTAHYVDDGITGFLVDSSAESLANAMNKYVQDPALAARHGRAGYQKMQGDYSVDEGYRKLIALLSTKGASQ